MHAEKFTHGSEENTSYTAMLRELVSSVTSLVRSELTLAKEEAKLTANRLAKHSAQAAIFGALCGISVIPFLAFLVIGLGNILGGQYWLSSLLVAIACAAIGGGLAYRAFKKIKENDLDLPRTRETLEREAHVVSRKLEDVQEATHRRAV